MNESLIALEAASPDQLRRILPLRLKSAETKIRYAALSIRNGPQVIVRPFEIATGPNGTFSNNIRSQLQAEAVDLLSLPVDQIELDFQSFKTIEGKTSGFYVCMPKALLKEYLSIIRKANLVPVKITTSILASIDSFFHQHEVNGDRFCLLDFSQKKNVHVAVFRNRQCEFLRVIPYESQEEADGEVIQSLRSACASSPVKTIDYVYFCGNSAAHTQLMGTLYRDFDAHIKHDQTMDVSAALYAEENFFNLNLAGNYSFSLREHRQILTATNVALLVLLVLCLWGGTRLTTSAALIHDVQAAEGLK